MSRIGDGPASAKLHRAAANAAREASDHVAALDHASRALVMFQRTGDATEEAVTLGFLAQVRHEMGDDAGAVSDYREAARLAAAGGDDAAATTHEVQAELTRRRWNPGR